MRTRSAKKLAQRIDLNYFKHARGMKRWRVLLSIAAPVAGLLWLGGMAAAGSRAPYSSGPVAAAHAFVELKCEVCHQRDTSFRAHVTGQSCLTCHDAPSHPPGNSTRLNVAMPACAACHREHQGRDALARTPATQCIGCHTESRVMAVGRFPGDHPPFAAIREGRVDPGTLKFNHAVHANENLRGPNGPETLACAGCHKPALARTAARRRPAVTGLMASINYEQQCARCHQLFFDERIDAAAPHDEPAVVRAFVTRALQDHVAANPQAVSVRDTPARRLPLNFPRAPEPQARTAGEWVAQRAARAERFLWTKGCADCHGVTSTAAGQPPAIAPVTLTARWMPKARFDHAPHLMVQCASCHTGAEKSRLTSDVLMPSVATCATCHAPSKGASSECVECHDYHDWTRAGPVKPQFKLTDFQ